MGFNPLSIITGGLGAAMPLVAAKMGVGKNTTNVTNFGNTSQYDPNKFEYGGRAGAADETAGRFSNLAAGAQNRQAASAGPAARAAVQHVDYSGANAYDAYGQQDRSGQGQAAALMMGRATGATPSIAQMQADRQMQQAAAAQASAGASARGAGGLALAGQNAANNTATMQSAISNQAQINAANERMQAEQAAFGAYSGMRGSDLASQGQASQQGQYSAQLGAQQNQFNASLKQNMAQYNAGLQAQRQQQNDAYSMGLYGQEAGVRNAQLTGGMNNQQILAGSQGQAQGQQLQRGQANADREFQYYNQFGQGLTGALGGATAGMGGGGAGAAGGGPVPQASPTGLGPAGGAQTGMVGIPTPSDDRMKFGMSPLSFLGMGGDPSGPGAGVDMGGKGYMSQGDVQAASSGLAGNGGGMPGMVGGGGVTGGNMGDMGMPGGGGGMGGGLLSDDHAKLRATYLQGRADAMSPEYAGSAYPGLGPNEELMVGRDGARVRPTSFAGARGHGSGLTDREIAARDSEAGADDSFDASFGTQPDGRFAIPTPTDALSGGVNVLRAQGERYAGLGVSRPTYGVGHVVPRSADPVTEQFARGLAPIRYEYQPGMGPPGRQTGVRAQQAETQPVTASMITRRPDGLRQIDPAMGLGTALAGVGHLAQKQREQEARLNELLGLTARREGY